MRADIQIVEKQLHIRLIGENPAENVILQLAEWDAPVWEFDKEKDCLQAMIRLDRHS